MSRLDVFFIVLLTAFITPNLGHTEIKNLKLFKQDELLVKFNHSASLKNIEKVNETFGIQSIQQFTFPNGLHHVRLKHKGQLESVMLALKKHPLIEYVEPNYIYSFSGVPNDADFGKQWALKNSAQNSGANGADINILRAWDHLTGSKDYVIGVIDTGILYSHPDLIDNMWVNPGEIPGNNIDDDLNGYIDDVYGINAITHSGDPRDDHGHGTHVAGIIGASGNNLIGISGVNQQTSLVGCKFLDARGSGSASDAITCLNYFADLASRELNPVNIVVSNNSWGGGGFSQALMDAIKIHEDLGILFVAAAANDSKDNDSKEAYPANYPLSNVISVAATDSRDELAYFSNYGSKTVHVAAPGANILSTYLNDKYKELSGTSMAAPHVSGLVGLIRAARPDLNFIQTRNLVITSGTKISSVKDKTISGRRITAASEVNGLGALTCLDQLVDKRLLPIGNSYTIAVGASLDLSMMSLNCENPSQIPLLQSMGTNLYLNDDGIDGDHLANDGVFSAKFSPEKAGKYEFNFGGADNVIVNVFDPSSWHGYAARTDSFSYREFVGSNLALSDDGVKTIEAPFPLLFGGDASGFPQIHVSANGILGLTNANISSYQNVALPYETVDTLIAPYWDDLAPTDVGGVYYGVLGSPPNREFVIEWRRVKLYGGSKTGSFQVIFFEGSSDILYNYLNVDFGEQAFGKSATVGVQLTKEKFLQYAFNEPKLGNKFALRFSAN